LTIDPALWYNDIRGANKTEANGNMQRILITGGTGSLGSALATRLYPTHKITILSRDECRQKALQALLPDADFILSDICNKTALRRAMVGQDILVHAAALKHVDLGQKNPDEFNRVNLYGTTLVAETWSELGNSPYALYLNTDKSVMAVNHYGKSKAAGEAVWRSYGYSVLRYGNVVGSNGSFLSVWDKLVDEGKPIVVREPDPTRFFLTISDAVGLVVEAMGLMRTGENNFYPPNDSALGTFLGHGGKTENDPKTGVFVPHSLQSFSIRDVAEAYAGLNGCNIEAEPLLAGEKIHEVLTAEGEVLVNPPGGKLGIVRPGFNGVLSSKTALRLSGVEVLKRLGRV